MYDPGGLLSSYEPLKARPSISVGREPYVRVVMVLALKMEATMNREFR